MSEKVPDGWKRVKLGEVAEILMGQSPKSKFYNNTGIGIPFLQGNRTFGYRYPKIDTYCSFPIRIAKKNCILLSVRAPVGDINIANQDICIGRGLAALNAINYNNIFLYYIMLFLKKEILSVESGTVFGSINKTNIENLEILLPSISEQKAIASVLSSLDDKIDLLHRQNQTLEQMAQTLFRKWFLEDANEDWEEYKIGDKLRVVLGGTPSTKKSEYWNGNIPWINSGEINKFRVLEPTKYITQLGLDNSNTKLLPRGTTVLAITGATLGQISILEIDACTNQSVIGIIGNEEFSNEYIYLWTKYYIKDIISNQTGGAQQHINNNDVKNAIIIKPDKETYKILMNIIKPIFNKILKNSFQIRTLENLRDTFLLKLMSGELRVTL